MAGDGRPGEILPEVYALRPWYHDFSALGLRTRFDDEGARPVEVFARIVTALARRVRGRGPVEKGERLLSRATLSPERRSHALNQPAKERHLLPLIDRALADVGPAADCLELFCADGYYSCSLAGRRPGARVTGVDLDPDEIARARTAARLLGFERATFRVDDAGSFVEAAEGVFDVVVCAGGLYHLADPRRLLAGLRLVTRGWLVVQSVVSLESEDPGYFVTPAPGWKHGSRFSHARLAGWLSELGWRIVAEERDELPGNRRRRDRGSSFFLCRPPTAPARPAQPGPRVA